MKQNPFSYAGEVSGEDFWDREEERRQLKRDILDCQKIVIYSKRRVGKTSLIKEVLRGLSEDEFIATYIDLYPTDSVDDFISRCTAGVSRAVRGPMDKALIEIKTLLRSFTPLLTVDDDGKPLFTIDFGRKAKKETLLEEVLEALPSYCKKKGKQGIIVFDEFQQIASYDASHKLEATLRSHFQGHNNVSYVFLGSRRHLLMEIFSSANRPFYHMAKMFPLSDIAPETMIACVEDRFKRTGCKIDHKTAERLVHLADNSIYYTQRLSHSVWNMVTTADSVVDEEDIRTAFKSLVGENEDYFRSMSELLTSHQLGALKVAAAIREGDKIFSRDFLKGHGWQKDSLKLALDALVDKDLISRDGGIYKVDDVFFRSWLVQDYY